MRLGHILGPGSSFINYVPYTHGAWPSKSLPCRIFSHTVKGWNHGGVRVYHKNCEKYELITMAQIQTFCPLLFITDTTECYQDHPTAATVRPAPTKAPNDIVPIAVGCALAGLVLIVLIAYVIGRRKSHSGYEKV